MLWGPTLAATHTFDKTKDGSLECVVPGFRAPDKVKARLSDDASSTVVTMPGASGRGVGRC